MSIEALETFVQKPELWEMSLSMGTIRDVLLELSHRVDGLASRQGDRPTSAASVHPADSGVSDKEISELNGRIDELYRQNDGQNRDFTDGIADVKAYVNFQLRDIRDVIASKASRVTSRAPSARPAPPPDTSDEATKKMHELATEVYDIHQRLDGVMDEMDNLRESTRMKIEPIVVEASQPTERAPTPDIEPVAIPDEESDPEPVLTERPADEDPATRDPRVDELAAAVEKMKARRRTDMDRVNQVAKTVNQMILEMAAQKTHTMSNDRSLKDAKGFADELERVYTKVGTVAVDLEAKIERVAAMKGQAVEVGKPDMTEFADMIKKLKQSMTDNLETMDQNYKKELALIRKELGADMKKLTPVTPIRAEPTEQIEEHHVTQVVERVIVRRVEDRRRIECAEVECQTYECQMSELQVMRVMTETNTKIPACIVTHEIVDREPAKVKRVPKPKPKPKVVKQEPKPEPKVEEQPPTNPPVEAPKPEPVPEPEPEPMEEDSEEEYEPKEFSLERMLNLTIVSDYQPPEPQQVVVPAPTPAPVPAIDIPAITKQVSALQEEGYMRAMRQMVEKHDAQISRLSAEVYDLLNPPVAVPGMDRKGTDTYNEEDEAKEPPKPKFAESEAQVTANESEAKLPSVAPASPAAAASGRSSGAQEQAAPQPVPRLTTDYGGQFSRKDVAVQTSAREAPMASPVKLPAPVIHEPEPVTVPAPVAVPVVSTAPEPVVVKKVEPNMAMVLVVNASSPPAKPPKASTKPAPRPPLPALGQPAAAPAPVMVEFNSEGIEARIDEVSGRVDKFEAAVSSIELQFYTLEKSLINAGGMRPNSADMDDDGRLSARFRRGGRSGAVMYVRCRRTDGVDESSKEAETARSKRGGSELEVEPEPEVEEEPETPAKTDLKPDIEEGLGAYTAYIPGEMSKQQAEREANQTTVKVVYGDAVSIEPNFEDAKKIEDAKKPEEITIPRYEDQFRILREAVVELRTNMQILKVKTDRPVMLPQQIIEEVKQKQESSRVVDDSAVRVLRHNVEAAFTDVESQIQDLRRELYAYMAHPHEKVIERIIESRPVELADVVGDQEVVKDAPTPKEINVELNILKAKAFLGDFEENRVMKITKIGELPDIESMDHPRRQHGPIVEDPLRGPEPPRRERAQAGGGPDASSQRGGHGERYQGGGGAGSGPQTYIMQGHGGSQFEGDSDFQGRMIPQAFHEMKVLNSVPKDATLESLVPYLVELRSDIQLQLDETRERLRTVEVAIPMKVDKEFVDAFFRKMRLALHETGEKVVKIQAQMPERPTHEDIELRIQDAFKSLSSQETTVAGKTSYQCLLCGSKRTGVTNQQPGRRGNVFKGRAAWPTQANDALPPLPTD